MVENAVRLYSEFFRDRLIMEVVKYVAAATIDAATPTRPLKIAPDLEFASFSATAKKVLDKRTQVHDVFSEENTRQPTPSYPMALLANTSEDLNKETVRLQAERKKIEAKLKQTFDNSSEIIKTTKSAPLDNNNSNFTEDAEKMAKNTTKPQPTVPTIVSNSVVGKNSFVSNKNNRISNKTNNIDNITNTSPPPNISPSTTQQTSTRRQTRRSQRQQLQVYRKQKQKQQHQQQQHQQQQKQHQQQQQQHQQQQQQQDEEKQQQQDHTVITPADQITKRIIPRYSNPKKSIIQTNAGDKPLPGSALSPAHTNRVSTKFSLSNAEQKTPTTANNRQEPPKLAKSAQANSPIITKKQNLSIPLDFDHFVKLENSIRERESGCVTKRCTLSVNTKTRLFGNRKKNNLEGGHSNNIFVPKKKQKRFAINLAKILNHWDQTQMFDFGNPPGTGF